MFKPRDVLIDTKNNLLNPLHHRHLQQEVANWVNSNKPAAHGMTIAQIHANPIVQPGLQINTPDGHSYTGDILLQGIYLNGPPTNPKLIFRI